MKHTDLLKFFGFMHPLHAYQFTQALILSEPADSG
jgi:hypothetical protein